MRRTLARLASLLVAVPLAATLGAPAASADVTVPGCYGVAVVVCEPTVDVGLPAGIELYEENVPICAGSCQYVRVTLVRFGAGEPLHACVSYRSLSGTTTVRCADPDSVIPGVQETLDQLVTVDVGDLVQQVADRREELTTLILQVVQSPCVLPVLRDIATC